MSDSGMPASPDVYELGEVTVDPGNPFDFTQAEIDELVTELQAAQPDAVVVSHFRNETEYGGGIVELVHLWLDLRSGYDDFRDFVNQNWTAIGVIAGGVAWLRRRWNEDNATSPRPRPRELRVYDQEARRIVQIDIDLPDGEPQVLFDDDDRHHHDKPSGARLRDPDPEFDQDDELAGGQGG